MELTLQQFTSIFGNKVPDAQDIVNQLNIWMPYYQIDTPDRVSCFLAQAGHESGGFMRKSENLNYKAEGLLKTFKKYFTPAEANAYAHQPEKIANHVYANRMGNGPERSGDGWRYRGAGWIQLTGHDNHIRCLDDLAIDVVDNPSYLTTIEGATNSACWFWSVNKLNDLADIPDMKKLTKRINGGYIGLEERIKMYEKIKNIIV